MASFFSNMGSRFGGKQGKGGNPKSPGSGPSSPAFPPSNENLPQYGSRSNSPASQFVMEDSPKYFFQEKYAKLGVRGNFMPLAAQPKHVELGDWLAHQAWEQFGNIDHIIACITEIDSNTGRPLCNPVTCPVMSAGRSHTYTWLNAQKEPVRVPAFQYIGLVRRWINGKIADPKVFPTDPLAPSAAVYASGNVASNEGDETPIAAGPTNLNASLSTLSGRNWVGKSAGYPENFFTDVRTIFRQIFRIYAHTYHSHWLNPFWHATNGNPPVSGWTDLNSCFVHFITVARLFGLLSDKDLEPMQPLIDIWVANGSIPADAANGACAVHPAQPHQ